jgi:hypothetical protein
MTVTSSRPGVEASLKLAGVRHDGEGPLETTQGHLTAREMDLG